jgi:poly(A) polymerase
MIKLKYIINESFKTRSGSVIRRYHDNVGKQIGNSLYVHKLYADRIIPKALLNKANGIMTRSNPDFDYNTLMWDVKEKTIRFDEAPDFDSAREPHVGEYVIVSLDGKFPPKRGKSNNIWHHKWLWVKDDYTGFDVDKSKEWSKLWLSKLEYPAKGTDLTWQSQLRQYNLVENQDVFDHDIVYGGIWGDGRIVAKANAVGHSSDMGYNRWIYYQSKGIVFWHRHPPDEDSKNDVSNYLVNKGYEVNDHRSMEEYYKIMKYLEENKQLQLMEGTNAKNIEAFLRDIIQGTEWAGKVFAVGGFVRDEIMGKTPKDLDVVVDKQQGGIEFSVWLAKKLGIYKEGSNPVTFPRFGTAKVSLDGVQYKGVDFTGEDLEAVMPRSEQYNDPNSRKPDVQYTDLKGDALRRDLTINAIYKDISNGQLLDPVGGVEDIKDKLIRTPIDPDLIYTDDALRMFRVIRFATQYGWELTPEVIAGIKRNLHRLGNTSKERIRDELNKILVTKDPSRGVRMLKDTGLLPYVAKELQQAVGMIQNVHHVHDVFDHTLEVLKNTKPELVHRLMALFHDIGKIATRSETPTGVHFYGHEDVGTDIVDKILRDLKYPLEIINAVKTGVRNHMRLKQGGDDAVKLSDKALRKFKIELGDNLEAVMDVIHADNTAHASASAMPNQIENVRKRLKDLDIQVKSPELPINGKDLQDIFHIKPGPIIGKILSKVVERWYENPNISRDEAIEIAKEVLSGKL